MLENIEKNLRANRLPAAETELREVLKKKLSRAERVTVAALARRLRLPEISVRLLFPVVRPSAPLKNPATWEEKAEYGAALYRLGATAESETLLREIPAARFAKAPLYLAFALQSRWAYAEAVGHLQMFLKNSSPASYELLIAGVNLCAGLVFLKQHDSAGEEIERYTQLARKQNAVLLRMNLLELAAQNELGQNEFGRAAAFLNQASQLAQDNEGLDAFFIEKWKTLSLLIATGSATAQREAERVRAKAAVLRHWETLRDIDWHLGRYGNHPALLDQVYWGTPHDAFRQRLLRESSGGWQPAADYEWSFGLEPDPSSPWLDITSGRTNRPGQVLKPGQVPHRLLRALAQDFYKPCRLLFLHGQIFPGEYFSPQSSAGRVHQATYRLKQFFSEAELPLSVRQQSGFFSLVREGKNPVALRGLSLRQPLTQPSRQTLDLVNRLRPKFASRPFTSREAAQKIKWPKRTLGRYLGDAVHFKLVAKLGDGRLTRYAFSSSGQNS